MRGVYSGSDHHYFHGTRRGMDSLQRLIESAREKLPVFLRVKFLPRHFPKVHAKLLTLACEILTNPTLYDTKLTILLR